MHLVCIDPSIVEFRVPTGLDQTIKSILSKSHRWEGAAMVKKRTTKQRKQDKPKHVELPFCGRSRKQRSGSVSTKQT